MFDSNENDTEVQKGNGGWTSCHLSNHSNCESLIHLFLRCNVQGLSVFFKIRSYNKYCSITCSFFHLILYEIHFRAVHTVLICCILNIDESRWSGTNLPVVRDHIASSFHFLQTAQIQRCVWMCLCVHKYKCFYFCRKGF